MHLHILELAALDLAPLSNFYATVLGLPTVQNGAELRVTAGESQLVFRQVDHKADGVYHLAFNIPQNLFSSAKMWLAARVPLVTAPDGADEFFSESWNSDACYFVDSDGNILELIARHTLNNDAVPPFGAHYFLNVSEIGVTTSNALDAAHSLSESTGASLYGQNPNEGFAPLGDAHGLFILVKHGRLWYPNLEQPAQYLPLRVTFTHADKEHTLQSDTSGHLTLL